MTRYGSPADVASVNSTLCLHNPGRESREVTLYAPAHWENEANLRVGQEARNPPLRSARSPWTASASSRCWPRSASASRPPPRGWYASWPARARSTRAPSRSPPGDLVVRYHTRLPLIAEPDGSYRFAEFVPRSYGAVPPGGELSIAVVMPRWGPRLTRSTPSTGRRRMAPAETWNGGCTPATTCMPSPGTGGTRRSSGCATATGKASGDSRR